MLKALKRKFVIIIMSIVTIFFILIFGAIILFTKTSLERESMQMMRAMSFEQGPPRQIMRPAGAPDRMNLAFFTIELRDGEIKTYGNELYDLSDTENLKELLEEVSSSDKPAGEIKKYDLRYVKAGRGISTRIIFTDTSTERVIMQGLIRNLLIIGLVAYAIIFLISIKLTDRMTAPIAKAWDTQKQFVADASHELKTPLTIIMTNAEMLQDENFAGADMAQLGQNILTTSKKMKGLVESLLELARLDSGRLPIKKDQLALDRLLDNCIMYFEPLFFESGLKLSVTKEEPVSVYGDKERLQQVINILLDNALKYADNSKDVSVSLKTQGHDCLLSVSSSGKALSADECRDIFKRFYRIDQARNDSGSYGLGLSIAERIIREHNGRIWAESSSGINTFYVQLRSSNP